VRSAFAQADIDHVIIGAGLDLETRLEIVREIFLTSDTTTVHMKDFASGPDGFLPFVRSVLTGLADDVQGPGRPGPTAEPSSSPANMRVRNADWGGDNRHD